jgi:DNA-directed RNA polymerase beta subunit
MQKGTIGIILPEHEMPVSEDGVIPEIIINPHAMPSRMTISQLIESVLGKLGATKGTYYDGTPFEKMDHDNICNEMEKCGFEKGGFETFYNGENGEKIEAQIFCGPTYYQRLKHMVAAKMHARATGPVSNLTRQPLEGRSREGGLRLTLVSVIHKLIILYY